MSALAAEQDGVLRPRPDFDLRDHFDGVSAFAAGVANVILQLGLSPVGHGVVEKPRPEGSVFQHPFKRLRTTFTYISVAMLGTDDDRLAMREAVNFSHRGVHSDPGAAVRFNAFDPQLQLWVAACLYFGVKDSIEKLHGPLDDEVADALYAESIRFGTTLQMPAHFWPANRAAFESYWEEGLERIHFDPEVGRYLRGLLRFKMLHPVMRLGPGQLMTFTNTGFLPGDVRDKLGLEWSGTDERTFVILMRGIGLGYSVMPRAARNFPFNYFLWDFRRRVRRGTPIV